MTGLLRSTKVAARARARPACPAPHAVSMVVGVLRPPDQGRPPSSGGRPSHTRTVTTLRSRRRRRSINGLVTQRPPPPPGEQRRCGGGTRGATRSSPSARRGRSPPGSRRSSTPATASCCGCGARQASTGGRAGPALSLPHFLPLSLPPSPSPSFPHSLLAPHSSGGSSPLAGGGAGRRSAPRCGGGPARADAALRLTRAEARCRWTTTFTIVMFS